MKGWSNRISVAVNLWGAAPQGVMQLSALNGRVLITDGLRAYHEWYLKEFHAHKLETGIEHVQDARFGGRIHNNEMERFNGELHDREKVMLH